MAFAYYDIVDVIREQADLLGIEWADRTLADFVPESLLGRGERGDGRMNAMAVEVRTEGPTPAGGAYAIAYFSRDGVPVDQSDATHVEITEYAADGTPIQRTYAILGALASPGSA